MRNLKLAIRTLSRTPLVSGVAIVSLALGIGANTAIFSMIQRILLRPLPVVQPDQLVNVLAPIPNPGGQTCNRAGSCDVVFSYPMFRDLENGQTGLALAAHRTVSADLAFRDRTVSGEGMEVSGSYFRVLGLKPTLGRWLSDDDDRTPGAHPVAVLNYYYWANELGADSSVLGQRITVNGYPFTVVGVGPRGFDGTTLGTRARIFLPLTMDGLVAPSGQGSFDDRRSYWLYVFGRLQPGMSLQQASIRLNSLYTAIINEVEVSIQSPMPAQELAEFKVKKVKLEPGARGQSSVLSDSRAPLVLLFSVTGIVLLVACTNVANLLLARAAGRASEMAIRSSLGAGRGQLIAQLITESMLLAALAGVTSLLVARWTLRLITSFLPGDLAALGFQLNPTVLGFAAVVALGTSLLFGLLPAFHSTRPNLLSVTKSGSGRGSAGREATRFRYWLVSAQMALSMALLCSAGLFVHSLANVSRVELGIRTDSVVTFVVAPEQIGYRASQTRALFAQLDAELAAIPGVTGMSSGAVPLLGGQNRATDIDLEGFPFVSGADVHAHYNFIGADYFKTLGIPIVSGRDFQSGDDVGTPRVAIVNEEFVRKFKLGTDALGHRLRRGSPEEPGTAQQPYYQIVGVVRNAAYSQVKDKIPPVFYFAERQDSIGQRVYYLRTRVSPSTIMEAIPPLVARLEPGLPVSFLKTLPQQVNENIFLDRMITTLSAAFASLATLLAAVGLYGVLAYTVTQRTREIGLRMALGADSARVRAMVLRQVAGMITAGVIIGVAAAVGIGRFAQSLLFELQAYDPLSLASAAVVLTLVALAAGLVPAIRASRVDPMEALRTE